MELGNYKLENNSITRPADEIRNNYTFILELRSFLIELQHGFLIVIGSLCYAEHKHIKSGRDIFGEPSCKKLPLYLKTDGRKRPIIVFVLRGQ